MNDERPRRKFKVRDLLVITACAAVLMALIMPFILRAREAARRTNCQNNMKQLILAVHDYKSTYRCLPNAMGGTGGRNEMDGNLNRLSGFILLTPYIEASPFFNYVTEGTSDDKKSYPAFGPAPWVSTFSPWRYKFPVFHCPSAPSLNYAIPPKNYAFCIGDAARNVHNMKEPRGMFAPGHYRKFSDVTDGPSYTIALCEIGTLSGRANQGQVAVEQPVAWLENPSLAFAVSVGGAYLKSTKLSKLGRGANWVDGAGSFNLVNTILPPNAPSILMGTSETSDGFFTAGSFHSDGVNFAFGDGSVRFVSNMIDTGDLTKPVLEIFQRRPATPLGAEDWVRQQYGTWGVLGSADGGDGGYIE